MIKIIKEKENRLRFLLLSKQNTPLFESVDFDTKDLLYEAFLSLKHFDKNHLRFERKTNHQGAFIFLVKNPNGKVLGESQKYNSEAGMENGIKNLKNRILHVEFKPS